MKEKIFHQKLIRDRIPETIEESGGEYETKVLGEEEFQVELKKKLVEEAKELAEAPKEELINELADVLELTKSIAAYYKIPFSDIEKFRKEKKQKRGGFDKRLFLIWSTKQSKK